MTLQEYLNSPESKYLVIGKTIWEQDSLAQSIAYSPRCFLFNGVEYTILSLDPKKVSEIMTYIESLGEGYSFGWTFMDGKVNFLTHSEALTLLQSAEAQA